MQLTSYTYSWDPLIIRSENSLISSCHRVAANRTVFVKPGGSYGVCLRVGICFSSHVDTRLAGTRRFEELKCDKRKVLKLQTQLWLIIQCQSQLHSAKQSLLFRYSCDLRYIQRLNTYFIINHFTCMIDKLHLQSLSMLRTHILIFNEYPGDNLDCLLLKDERSLRLFSTE